jgi:O-antigen/teichoic acid export membrane protein
MVADLRLRSVMVAQGVGAAELRDFVLLRVVTSAVAFVVTLILGSVADAGGRQWVVLSIVSAAKVLDSLSDICYGFFQSRFRLQASAVGLVINGVASIVLVVGSLWAIGTLEAATIAYAGGSLIALVFWNAPIMGALLLGSGSRPVPSRLLAGFRFSALWRLAIKTLPLGLSGAVGSVHSNIPQYVVATALGPAHLAPFAALAYLPAAGNIVTNAVSQAILPELARDFVCARRMYIRRLVGSVAFGLALGLVGTLLAVLWGPAIISAVYTADYAQNADLLIWLSATAAVAYGYVFLGAGAVARQRFGSQLAISVLGLISLTLLAPTLVKRFGVNGAAHALFAAAIVQAVAYVILTMCDLSGAGFRARSDTHHCREGARVGPSG